MPGTLVQRTERSCAEDGVVPFGPFQTSFREGEGAGARLARGDPAAWRLSSPVSFNLGNSQENVIFEMPKTTSDLRPSPWITSSAEPNVEF